MMCKYENIFENDKTKTKKKCLFPVFFRFSHLLYINNKVFFVPLQKKYNFC